MSSSSCGAQQGKRLAEFGLMALHRDNEKNRLLGTFSKTRLGCSDWGGVWLACAPDGWVDILLGRDNGARMVV